ncbi:hypothetical protein [Streptomyces albipurpureus]|uniref:Uncharacterized protein n=1 Tax=Streptomyces albipurpureus TaxID=2897419 RepID=A0ABT0UV46_9ACTN|nr:hypothetical protein [Streptomyces sp. CWNU-1]MCM2391238.1 hypothetical protein [Streptomyces sp. CWNU-1]
MSSVTAYTGAVFNNGSIRRLLDLAIDCRRTGGPSLEDELARFCRTIRNSPEAEWAIPLATVAALLDLLSEQLDPANPPAVPTGFSEKLNEASGDVDGPEFLGLLAGLIRMQDQEVMPDFESLPMAPWEARLTFPRIRQFSYWVDSGEYDDFEEGLRAGAASEHPHGCHQETSRLAAELQVALLLFPTPEALRTGLGAAIPWASVPILQAILRAIHVHFTEQH